MLSLINIPKQLFIVAFSIFCFVYYFQAQISPSLTIEQAKNKLEQLQSNYLAIDEIFDEKIENEIAKQISTKPKGEFENTQEYNARLAKAKTFRKKLKVQFEPEKQNRRNEIRKQINSILDQEFTKPVGLVLGMYNADEERFPVTVKSDGQTFPESLFIPRNEAKLLKEYFSQAEAQGVFGLGLDYSGEVIDYFSSVRVKFGDNQYSNLPLDVPLNSTAQSAVLSDKVKLNLKEGKLYATTRKVLMATGWKPVFKYRNLSEYDREDNVVKNLHFYEMESCSGTGVGYCNFIFKGKDGKILTITTVGNDETEGGKPTVSGYRID